MYSTNKFNWALFGLTNKRNDKKEAIERKYKNSDWYMIMVQALHFLNPNAFLLFENKIEERKKLWVINKYGIKS